MKVYLDNCCFNHPFDDQSNVLVRLETEAKLCIQMDASHIACAISSGTDYFITVDKKVLNKVVRGICIANPIDFIRSLLNDD